MPVPQLVLRIPKGAPLTPGEMDGDFTILVNFANGLETRIQVTQNADGTLKANIIDTAQIIDKKVTAAKLEDAICGAGLVLDGVTHKPTVNFDNVTIYVDGTGKLAIKPGAIPGSAKQILLRESRAPNTAAGALPANADITRALTTLAVDETGVVVLSASAAPNAGTIPGHKITLPAGTYDCEIFVPGNGCNAHKAWLHNVTDNAIIITGSSEWSSNAALYAVTKSVICGRFVLAAPKDVEIRHRSAAGGGMGVANNINGMNEIYTIAKFWQLA